MNRKIGKVFYGFFFCLLCAGKISATVVDVYPGDNIQNKIDTQTVSGDTLAIHAGTYIQEFQVISKDLNIVGDGEGVTIIQAPPPATHLTQVFSYSGGNFWCIVMIDNQAAPTPQTVNISNLTVDGDNQQDTAVPPIYGGSNGFYAIGYHNANGTVTNVHTTNTKQSATFNEVTGGGIVNASNTGTVTFNVTGCLVDFYQRIGIDCRGSALTAYITNSTVNRGFTAPLGSATPNGIQYSGGATGGIIGNTVVSNISTVSPVQGTGMILVGTGANLLVSGNNIINNDIGIVAFSECGNNLIIQNNTVTFTISPGVSPIEGIIVQDTAGLTTLTGNIINDVNNVMFAEMDLQITPVSLGGVGVNEPFNLANNQFIGGNIGLFVSGVDNTPLPPTGPVVTMNGDSFTGTVGYYIQENDVSTSYPVTTPNNIWPSTGTVYFDGLLGRALTFAEYTSVLTKIYDQHNNSSLGLVLNYVASPSDFVGVIKANKFLNKTEYVVFTSWTISSSQGIAFYRIYENGKLVAQIPASSPLVYTVCADSQKDAQTIQITSVDIYNGESMPVSIRIIHE